MYYFEQSGTNVVVTGAGSINTAALGAPSVSFPWGTSRTNANFGLITAQTGTTQGTAVANLWQDVAFPVLVGPTTVTGGTLASGLATGSPLTIELDAGDDGEDWLLLPQSYVSGSVFSNSATLLGVSNGGLGYSTTSTWASPDLERLWTVVNPTTGVPTGDTIAIYSVPEPAHMTLVAGLGAAAFGAWRMRRRSPRRSDEASGC